MRLFYAMLIYALKAELAIAQSTGRDPRNIQQLRTDLNNAEADLHRWEVRNASY